MKGGFRYFVILGGMRTGSNFLEACLSALPGIQGYGELFNPSFAGKQNAAEFRGIDLAAREQDPLRVLNAIFDDPNTLPGFRFFGDHDPRILQHVLQDEHCAKITLTRNPVESYVSLKIARETDQWRLQNVKNRRVSRPAFDKAEFSRYLLKLQSFQAVISEALQLSGQTAFHIQYEDISKVDVINGLARFLGSDARLEALPKTLKRQNPEPLKEKVSNFSEMQADLADADFFNLLQLPSYEPDRGASVPGYLAAPQSPLLFMPIKGVPSGEIESWLAAVDGAEPGAVQSGFTQKTLRQWMRKNCRHRKFAAVCHPLLRAHEVFCSLLSPDETPQLRDRLADVHKIPLPKTWPDASYDKDRHHAAFLMFLKFLALNLSGQTGMRTLARWANQSTLIAGMSGFTMPDHVIRYEALQQELSAVAGLIGVDAPDAVSQHSSTPFDLSEIYSDALEEAAHAVYRRDYLMLGYGRWKADHAA